MKKLMFAMSAVALAVSAQAASTWTATIEFGEEYSNYHVWTVIGFDNTRATALGGKFKNMTAPDYGQSGQYYADTLSASTKNPEEQIRILNNDVKTDYNTWSGAYTCLKNLKTDANGTATIQYNGSYQEQYSWLFVLTSGATATYGTEYAVIQAHESPNAVSYTGGDITKPVYTANANYTTSGDKITVLTSGIVAAPEPTSGLLLLLGVAGLALKRRRA